MSLKAFHVFFLTICIILTLGVTGWGLREYLTSGGWGHLVLSAISLVLSVLLVLYSQWFMRKLKNVSYL